MEHKLMRMCKTLDYTYLRENYTRTQWFYANNFHLKLENFYTLKQVVLR